jgi:hypothetical protein
LQEITVEGLNFKAPKTWVRLGALEPIRVTPRSDREIRVEVPDNQYPADADHPALRPIPEGFRLQPGPQLVEVLTEWPVEVVSGGLDPGETLTRPRVPRSNQGVFLLVPEIASVNPTTGSAAGLLTITGKRLYRAGLKCFVLIGDVALEIKPPGAGDSWAAPTATQVQVSLAALAALEPLLDPGPYPVRVRVNGAQNLEEGFTYTLTP